MAAGDRIFMAKESTSQEILSNTKKIIEDAKAKPKRYGMRINLLDSNPATRVKYLYDAVGMTPAGMNFAGGGFDYGDWGDIWFVKKNRPVMVRTDGTVDYELNHENHALKLKRRSIGHHKNIIRWKCNVRDSSDLGQEMDTEQLSFCCVL